MTHVSCIGIPSRAKLTLLPGAPFLLCGIKNPGKTFLALLTAPLVLFKRSMGCEGAPTHTNEFTVHMRCCFQDDVFQVDASPAGSVILTDQASLETATSRR